MVGLNLRGLFQPFLWFCAICLGSFVFIWPSLEEEKLPVQQFPNVSWHFSSLPFASWMGDTAVQRQWSCPVCSIHQWQLLVVRRNSWSYLIWFPIAEKPGVFLKFMIIWTIPWNWRKSLSPAQLWKIYCDFNICWCFTTITIKRLKFISLCTCQY